MSNRGAKRSLCSTLRVNMNILIIARRIGKLVNSILIYFNPIGDPNFLTQIIVDLISADNIAHFKSPLSIRAL